MRSAPRSDCHDRDRSILSGARIVSHTGSVVSRPMLIEQPGKDPTPVHVQVSPVLRIHSGHPWHRDPRSRSFGSNEPGRATRIAAPTDQRVIR